MIARALLLTAWLAVCSVLGGAAATAVADADEAVRQEAARQVEQPLNNAPVWREVRSGTTQTTQATGREAGVLIQAAGETWRKLRNGPVTLIGGLLLILVPIAIGLYYRWKGPLKLHGQPTGKLVKRFSSWERIIHWSTAVTFVILALTGILMLFGRYFLIPVIGHTGFSWFAVIAKNVHNLVGPLFIFSVACLFVTFVRDNIWHSIDWQWLKQAPKVLDGTAHVPSGRFNAAEKGWWSVRPGWCSTFRTLTRRGAPCRLRTSRTAWAHCCSSSRRWATSTWARSVPKARTRRCVPVTSTRPGRRNITSSGSTM